jgi:hypothetical protein
MILFCEKCSKIVPEKEVRLVGTAMFHYYETSENLYKNAGTNRIGYCPQIIPHFCGKLREPTDIEYFIYHTLK